MGQAYQTAFQAEMRLTYEPLLKALNVTDAETEAFFSILVRYAHDFSSSASGEKPPGKTTAAIAEELRLNRENQLQSLLGPRYAEYRAYHESLGTRGQLAEFLALQLRAGSSMTPTQAIAVSKALSDSRLEMRVENGTPIWPSREEFARIVGESQGHLTPDQARNLKSMLDAKWARLELRRLSTSPRPAR
jgi:hypothetical protein